MHIVNEKLWAAQKSGFAVVRRIAIELKSMSPVDEIELEELTNSRLSYPDVQLSIVQRLIDHRQVNHIEQILNYFVSKYGSTK